MTDFLMAAGPSTIESVGYLVVGTLAVVGAGAIGWFGAGFGLQMMARMLTTQKFPAFPKRVLQGLTALVLGWLVALFVYGTGGFGFGMGPGLGQGEGGPLAENTPDGKATRKEDPKEEKPPPAPEALHIDLLGDARAQGGLFYRVEGDARPLALPELRERLRELRRREPPLKSVELSIYADSPDRDHPAVRDLQQWARENELTVSLTFPPGNAP